ncbi:hypothetical protein PFISCL1PPCAC_20965, partial [Pristionchus fissidentatus]
VAAAAAGPATTPFVPPSTTPIPLPRECPTGSRVFPSAAACYWIVKEKMPWWDAERECVRKGGKLASVESEDENEFIHDYSRRANISSPTFWLGKLIKNRSSGQYAWHDGVTPRNSGIIKNFITKEGDGKAEMCVTMWSDSTPADGSWQVWSCSQTYSGVCKRKYRVLTQADLRSTIPPLEDSIQVNRCCTQCGKACASNERCIPDDLDCLVKDCAGEEGYGWCLPAKEKN